MPIYFLQKHEKTIRYCVFKEIEFSFYEQYVDARLNMKLEIWKIYSILMSRTTHVNNWLSSLYYYFSILNRTNTFVLRKYAFSQSVFYHICSKPFCTKAYCYDDNSNVSSYLLLFCKYNKQWQIDKFRNSWKYSFM